MANSRVDEDRAFMFQEHGTKCLITDLTADKYLSKASRNSSDQEKFKKPCGGKGGWDDFTERWH